MKAPRIAFHIPFILLCLAACASASAQTWSFQCSAAKPDATHHPLNTTSLYKAPAAGTPAFGFDLSTVPTTFTGGACSSVQPFFFSVAAPDGNYRVTLVLGGPQASIATIRAESRRLFLDQRPIAAGKSFTISFNVNVRTATIATKAGPISDKPLEVRLKPREIGALDWDEKLTVEFNGDHPSVRSISIEPASVPTVYLAGDSTVVDQDKEPWAAWGQMIPLFFNDRIAIANEAESGETIKSFVGERRLAKVMSTIRPGDYLMIQFGHNDQKQGAGYVPAETDFKTILLDYIAQARAHGATPILVTPMNRRNFDADGKIIQTLGDYPAALREVAREQHIALIDLNASSKILYEALGDAGTLHAFVHYPANTFPNQPDELKDDTHFNSYGAYELARIIIQSIRDQHLPLESYLRLPIPPFDPAHPEPFTTWTLPPSPNVSIVTPYGR